MISSVCGIEVCLLLLHGALVAAGHETLLASPLPDEELEKELESELEFEWELLSAMQPSALAEKSVSVG